jgi:pyrophosphatase PpaX
MIKAVLFDLDGTVVNTNNLILESYKHTLKTKLGFVPDDKELVKYFGEPLITTLKRFDEENAEELRKTYVEFNERMHDELALEIKGIYETFERLKRNGFKIAIVTSKRKIMADKGLNLFNLMNFIDIMVTPENTEKHKPDPEPVLKACELLEIEPVEALVVGDSHYDILCGKNAGAYTCAVKYTALPIEMLLKYSPDFLIDDPNEIIDIIGNINNKSNINVSKGELA